MHSIALPEPETLPNISLLPAFFRGVFAVILGLVVTGALSAVTDELMKAIGFFPTAGTMLASRYAAALAYRVVFQIGGCALAGRLAKSHPMRIAMILAIIGFVGTAASTLATWNLGMGPHWYALAVMITALPCGWVGGRLAERAQPANG